MTIFCEIVLRWMLLNLLMIVNIGSGNDLVLTGYKPLPEPRALSPYEVALGLSELTLNMLNILEKT